ncbi:MAG: hypothetical protein K5787_20705 [Lentisphaeria bacterium]|nr:hypothetical protein [Lentisphaeria bacterium]
MKRLTLFCMMVLFAPVYGIESQPFDCVTPIILAPILQHMRENINDKECKEDFLTHAKSMQAVITLSRKSPVVNEGVQCDSIDEITYDIPNKNTFRLFVDKGLVIKLQHIDNKGTVHEYHQIARDRINQIHFDDVEYERESKDCLLKVYMGESPFGLLQEGRHTVIFNYKFKDYLGIGSVVFQEASLEYKFSFHNGQIHNAGLKNSKKILVYSLTIHEGKVKRANVFDNSQLRSGFDCIFYDDLGLRMYSPMLNGVQDKVTIWGPEGKEKTVYNFNDWLKMGMPMNNVLTKKRMTNE